MLGNIDVALKKYDEMPDKIKGLVMKQLYFYSQKERKKDEFEENQRQIQRLVSDNSMIKDPKTFLHLTIKVLSAQMKFFNNAFKESEKYIH
jgi:hypothetical protein